jgi:hypothetical protein
MMMMMMMMMIIIIIIIMLSHRCDSVPDLLVMRHCQLYSNVQKKRRTHVSHKSHAMIRTGSSSKREGEFIILLLAVSQLFDSKLPRFTRLNGTGGETHTFVT